MFAYRAISFPLLLALLAATVFWDKGGAWLFLGVAVPAIGLATCECCRLLERCGLPVFAKTGGILIGIISLLWFLALHLTYFGGPEWFGTAIQSLWMLTIAAFGPAWLGLLFAKDKKQYVIRLAGTLGVGFLLATPLFLVAVAYYDSPAIIAGKAWNCGARQLLFLILVTKAMDTGGYIAGMLSNRWMKNGNHKIAPSISPKKSWEGTIGGILLSVGVAIAFYYIYQNELHHFTRLGKAFWWYPVAGVILAIGSLAGDLTESTLKRAAGVKDSGEIIPGMGGVFDVLDSFLYNGILFWLLASLA